jgi:hypothetical protein
VQSYGSSALDASALLLPNVALINTALNLSKPRKPAEQRSGRQRQAMRAGGSAHLP